MTNTAHLSSSYPLLIDSEKLFLLNLSTLYHNFSKVVNTKMFVSPFAISYTESN